MTIKVTTTKEVVDSFEISLPKFRKSFAFYYKIFSENKCICVEPGENPAVSICPISRAYYSDTIQDCEEEVYLNAYNQAINQILDEKHEL